MGKAVEKHGAPPVFYADQPAELALGPFVCKLTLGVVETDGSDVPRPVVTLVMPTAALLQLSSDLSSQFDDDDFKRLAVQNLNKAAKAIASGVVQSHYKAFGEPSEILVAGKVRRRVVTKKATD